MSYLGSFLADIEKKKYEAVIVNKSASTHSVVHARRSGRSTGSPKSKLLSADPLHAISDSHIRRLELKHH